MDVIVVGCGASGIAALRKLHDAGLKALGLEAADRIGGRIKTVKYGEGNLDLGAAWCHGEKDNIVFELANPLGLLGKPEPDNKWYVLSNGEILPNNSGAVIENSINEVISEAEKDNSLSMSECLRNESKSKAALQKDPNLTASFIEWFERNNHVGGQIDPKTGKSLKGLIEHWPCEGEFMLNWKGKGYRTILDVLLNKYPDPTKEVPVQILLNKEVECIKWSTSKKEQSVHQLVQIKCRDGSLFAAKSVIVTVSIGILKNSHEKLFDPPLPKEKIVSINSLQLCVLDKIYIEFEKPWWPKTPANFTILWRPEDKEKYTKNDQWITEIYGMMTVAHQPNLLLAWIYGEGAKAMEKLPVQKVKEGVEKLLQELYGNNFNIVPVKSIIRSQWASDPYTCGAYAYRSVETEENGGSAVILSKPLMQGIHPIVCFAGEATSHRQHSAVHGAIEAGEREAERLITHFKSHKI